jgi:hypothetical protein
MKPGEQREFEPGTKELVFAIRPDTDFKTIVSHLEKILTLPELPGIRGCSPCFSGLDRFVLESRVLERF